MSEYIEREQAVTVFKTFYGKPLRIMLEALAEEHAADVRPVVLCRDCEHYTEIMYGGTQFEYGCCGHRGTGPVVNPDDFCSRGEKREETTNGN